MTEMDIVKRLEEAKKAYYGSDSPLMDDHEFDALEEALRRINPGHPYFSTVGTGGEGKITHQVPMLSMGKVKSPQEAYKWIDRLALPEGTAWTIQPKIDGLSASCSYSGGKLRYVATRGDGRTGQDVSYIAQYIKDIPKQINEIGEVEVRGELYLPKDTSYDTGGKPLRNNCVGLINRKEGREELVHVRFVVYQTARLSPANSEAAIVKWLRKEGFHCVETFSFIQREELERLYQTYLETYRDQWLYETDGLILVVDDNRLHVEIDSRWIVDHHHHYAIALKPPGVGKRTRLKGVEWQVSRQGSLVPVALFDSIELGGATLSRASLHNYGFVCSLGLEEEDELLIERANDVIPYVRENLSARSRQGEAFTSSFIPLSCPVCQSELREEGVHLKCTNLSCPERLIQTILFWIRESGVEQIAVATVRLLYEKGIVRSPGDLYKVKSEDLANLEGFGEKKIQNFIHQFERTRRMNAPALISRLGIPLVQQKALKKLGINTIEDFWAFEDDSYVIGQNIIAWKKEKGNQTFLKDLLDVVELQDVQPIAKGQICMTGKGPLGRKELQALIEERGYEFSEAVTQKTKILLCEDPQGNSTKLQKARASGTRLMSYKEFLDL